MSTSYPNSDHPWDDINDIIQSLVRIFYLQFQTTGLYNMEYIYLTIDKCSYVGM